MKRYILFGSLVISLLFPFYVGAQSTRIVSLSYDGSAGNSYSWVNAITPDGRFIVSTAFASNIVQNDTNETEDIFIYDRTTGLNEIVSRASNGSQGNNSSRQASISADGRFISFTSYATNFIANDVNGPLADVFIHDKQTGSTDLISVSSNGEQGNGNSSSSYAAMSSDGRFVVFLSDSSNLVANDINNRTDVFVRDRQSGTTEIISISTEGTQGNLDCHNASISANGQYVVFMSEATNLIANDTSGGYDIFVRDRTAGITERVSISTSSAQANANSFQPFISTDGKYVGFSSEATNLVANDTNNVADIFIRNRETGVTDRVSIATNGTEANGVSGGEPIISPDGRFVVFTSWASNLVTGDTNVTNDVFLRDRLAGTTECISVTSEGLMTNSRGSGSPWISDDGRFVAFSSYAFDLVPNDANFWTGDVFIRDRSVDQNNDVNRILTINKAGVGNGSVTPDINTLSWTGNIGTASYVIDTTVILTAAPDPGSTFVGWSGGGCSGTDTCEVTLWANTSVTSNFDVLSYTVIPSAGVNGSLSPSTPQSVNFNQTTNFTVTPDSGYRINGVSGCGGSLSGSTYTTGPITTDCTVTASFELIPPQYNLTLTLSGNGTGVVHSLPVPDINCTTGSCLQGYDSGTVVTLTATPNSGMIFDRWSGACSGTSATCQVTMDAAKSVDARFRK